MPPTTEVSASQKSAYQRPYKTRGERREIARRKHDENADHKFLVRIAVAMGLLLLVALGIALKSSVEPESSVSPVTEAQH